MATLCASNLPVELWEQIISKLDHDLDRHLPSLSLVCKYFCSITSRFNHTLRVFPPTALLLSSLLRRFSNISHISFSDFSGDAVPPLLLIAQFELPLQTLDLSNLDRLPVDALRRFPASILSGVKSLKICYLKEGFDDNDLEAIAALFPTLEELDLSRHSLSYRAFSVEDDYNDGDYHEHHYGDRKRNTSNDGISSLASKLSGSLRRIDLKGNSWASDESLISLCNNCPNLEEIVVKGCRKVTPQGIATALKASKNLKTIGFHRIQLDPSQFQKPLPHALNLSSIVFSHTAVSDSLLEVIAEANLPLRSFSLINCCEDSNSLTFAGLSWFLECYDSLHHLVLVGVYFLSDKSAGILAESLTMLRSVNLSSCQYSFSELTVFTLIQQCPLLEALEMSHSVITEGSQSSPVFNAEIRTLDLSFSERLSDEFLEKIALSCPNLETLRVGGCTEISNKGVGLILRDCHSLKHLDIVQCKVVTGLGLGNDHKRQLNLESLEASKLGLNDQALIDIAEKCPHLMVLDVANCERIASKGVKRVVDKCTKLKEMGLCGCPNLSVSILPWLVFCKQIVRKISPPQHPGITDYNLYLRNGCKTGEGIHGRRRHPHY